MREFQLKTLATWHVRGWRGTAAAVAQTSRSQSNAHALLRSCRTCTHTHTHARARQAPLQDARLPCLSGMLQNFLGLRERIELPFGTHPADGGSASTDEASNDAAADLVRAVQQAVVDV